MYRLPLFLSSALAHVDMSAAMAAFMRSPDRYIGGPGRRSVMKNVSPGRYARAHRDPRPPQEPSRQTRRAWERRELKRVWGRRTFAQLRREEQRAKRARA